MRQGRFEALVRDLRGTPLLEATTAMAEGRLRMNGEPYAWEADEMAYWLRDVPTHPDEVAAERARVRFDLARADAVATAAPTPAAFPGGP